MTYYDLITVPVKTIDKHVFTWVFAVILGGLGVDRFYRGQIGYGILKLITGGGFGLWWLIDALIAAIKSYGNAYGEEDNLTFNFEGTYLK